MKKTSFAIAGKTDPGCVRTNNEDCLAIDEDLGLLVVADGMGGHNSGEVASRLAADTILDYCRKMLGGDRKMIPEGGDKSKSIPARQLEYFVQTANTMIFEKARAFAKDRGMGTTVVAALLDGPMMTVAHVGDSRFYVYRQGQLQVITQDHSLVMDQVRRGLITAEDAEKSGLQNILTRALGTEADVVVDVEDHPVLAGDKLLLCTDGLTKMVTEPRISEILAAEPEPAGACDALIGEARKNGGVDNITVIVAAVTAPVRNGVKGFFDRMLGK